MEIRVLRYFLEVAREGNITKAAAFLHISQPTLSRQLKDLEDELGKKLFVRSNYSIRLTDEGMLLRKRAEDILDMVDKTTDEFKSLDEITGGDIRIGCAESENFKYFVYAAKSLNAKYPNIRYHLYSSATDSVTDRLERGLLDFAIIVQSVDLSKYNYLSVPSNDIWGVLMRKDDPMAERAHIRLDDLIGKPLICSRQSLTEEMPKWLGEDLDKLNIVATYDLLFNASVMAREGLGYVLGFSNLIYTGKDSTLCFRPLEPPLESPMHIIWKKYQVFSPVASLFLEAIQKQFGIGKFDIK
ncbi:LysR family transcriptional regulator [Beduinella massiliensis]|uniref:LysR family transcriptional regulator n=1 Tax=Beduinella massiliensis TaxID=1852363 RepID=UPI000C83CBC6